MSSHAVASMMRAAKNSATLLWAMINEQGYTLANIPAWVELHRSDEKKQRRAPVAETLQGTQRSEEVAKEVTLEPLEKRTLYTEEQLIQMGRLPSPQRTPANLSDPQQP